MILLLLVQIDTLLIQTEVLTVNNPL